MKTQLKRRVRQSTLLAFMLTTAFGAVGASAADDTTSEAKPTAAPAAAMTEAKPVMVKSVAAARIGSGLLMQPAHERNYLKLLVGAYAPDSLEAWKQALEDRKQAESELPKPSFKLGTANAAAKSDEAAPAPAPASPAVTKIFTLQPAPVPVASPEGAALPAPAAEMRTITITKDGNGDRVTAIQALPLEGAAASGDIMKLTPVELAKPAALPESFERQRKLAEAVEADDAEAVRSLLPAMLEDYKKETEHIRNLAQTLKEQAAKAEEQK